MLKSQKQRKNTQNKPELKNLKTSRFKSGQIGRAHV